MLDVMCLGVVLAVLAIACAASAVNLEVTPVAEIGGMGDDVGDSVNSKDYLGEGYAYPTDEPAWPKALTPQQSQANMKKWEKEGKVKWDGSHVKGLAITDVATKLERYESKERELGERKKQHKEEEAHDEAENESMVPPKEVDPMNANSDDANDSSPYGDEDERREDEERMNTLDDDDDDE